MAALSPILGADGAPMRRAASDIRDTTHEGASRMSRETARWHAPILSADAGLLYERDTLVSRARDQAANNGWVAGGLQRQLDAVIGQGLRLRSKPNWRALGLSSEWAFEFADQVEAKWREYAMDPRCWIDSTRQSTFAGLCGTAFRHRVVDGEGLAVLHWIPNRGARYALAVELVDPDRLANPIGAADSNVLRGGIELDGYGAFIAAHIRKSHPSDIGFRADGYQVERVARFTPWGRPQCVHFFEPERAGQHRGKSMLAPVLAKLRMGDKYDKTELQAAVLNAVFAAFIQSKADSQMVSELLDGGDGFGDYQKERAAFYGERAITVDGVAISNLFPGDEATFPNAARPHSGHWPFIQTVLRSTASALGISYEQLSGDWSAVNYSSARAALIEVWRFLDARRFYFAQSFATPIYAAWLEEAIDLGDVELPPGAPDFYEAMGAYTDCEWLGPARGWVDPTKEAQGALMRIDGQISTSTIEAAIQGNDYDDVLEQQARERARRQQLNLPDPGAGARGQAPVEHASDIEAREGQKP
ncbi:phage portal protein [Pacificispira sp.]|uniref:phage portal protein n=1 Tax=Pacificispira sp. TaxID=2888761 RepID=UPI003BA96BDA